jgi:hypothetical protein
MSSNLIPAVSPPKLTRLIFGRNSKTIGHSDIRPRNEAASSTAQYPRSARAIAPKVAASVRSFPENGGVVSGIEGWILSRERRDKNA